LAQVGRISGPLLYANLERNGIDLAFRNDLSTTQLLYIDVNTGKIGVNNGTPTRELDVLGTTRTTTLISGPATTPGFNITDSTFSAFIGDIFLDAQEAVVLSTLDNGTIKVNDNIISTTVSNSDIDIVPNGSGILDVQSDLEVFGNIDATGNITFDGSITFGDDSTVDTITFESDITSDINPDADGLFDLGSSTKKWNNAYIERLNGELIITDTVLAGGVSYNLKHGNQFYVAVNGNDSNVGDHILAPLSSIKEALSRADSSTAGPVSIYVAPGEYQEDLPLVVPPDVSIVGEDVRNVIIKPSTAYQSEDVFHLNGEATISNLTIKDFFYDSINDKGYAFRFAPGGVISTRSPYVQNCTVITQGSTTSVSDPRGFDEGDAGKGALVDGAELDSASVDASMLFHSVTFITPGVDALTMTNGVRVEWLNSFTYFANRGLYAINGVTGRTSPDGSTVIYGAEIRSIGSASVYGNYGAVADGSDTLMYLIQHNLAYIGTGKDKENDVSLVNQDNEVVELNSGRIQFVTTDHTGAFRVGDNFFVDFETGSTTLNADDISADAITNIEIVDGSDKTIIDVSKVQTGNVRFFANTVGSTTDNLNFTSAADINITADTSITQNLDITGNLSFDGSLNLLGNQPTDLIEFNVNLDQNFNPHSDSNFNLGSATKQWSNIWLSEIDVDNVNVFDNVITTKDSNSNLELRANGTGNLLVPNTATFSNNLTVNGISTFTTVNIDGNLNPNNVSIPNPITINSTTAIINQDIDISQSAQFEEILFDDNFITTTSTNANLELRANGTGNILIPNNDVQINNNLSADDITSNNNTTITTTVEFGTADVSSVDIQGNYFSSNTLNADLELRSSGTGNIVIPNNNVTFGQDLTVNGTGGAANDGVVTSTFGGGEAAIQKDLFGDALLLTGEPSSATWIAIQTLEPGDAGIITSSGIDYPFTLTSWNSIDREEAVIDIPTLANGFSSFDITVTIRPRFDGTSLQNTSITGTLTHIGNRTQTGNFEIAGEISNSNILFEDNFITATNSNSDLEIRASGTGEVLIPNNNLQINNNLTVNTDTNLQDTTITGTLAHTGNRIENPGAGPFGEQFQGADIFSPRFFFVTGRAGFSGRYNIFVFDNVEVARYQPAAEMTTGDIVDGNRNGNSFRYKVGEYIGQGSSLISNYYGSGSTQKIYAIEQLPYTHTLNGELTVDNVYVEDNFISTTSSNLILGATGDINVDANDVKITQDLTVSGLTTLQGTAITGTLTHVGNTTQTGNLDVAGEFTNGNVLIEDNFITTTNSNSDLELRANGTGEVVIDTSDTLTINNNLFVEGTLTYQGTLTINGNLTLQGNVQDGSLTVTENFAVEGNLSVDSQAQFEDIRIEDNFITTTATNSDLELRASGTGNVVFDENVIVDGNLFAASITTGDININADIVLNEIVIPPSIIEIDDNFISTKISNADLDLRANGIGDIVIESNDVNISQDLTVNGETIINDNVSITGSITQTGNYSVSNNLSVVNFVVDGDLDVSSQVQLEEILFDGNVITTTTSDADLELRSAGTGNVLVSNNNVVIEKNLTAESLNDIETIIVRNTIELDTIELSTDIQLFENVITTTNSNSNLELRANGTSSVYTQNLEFSNDSISTRALLDSTTPDITFVPGEDFIFNSTGALKLPSGTTGQRINGQGDLRFNLGENVFEGYNTSTITLGGVYSEDRKTTISAHPVNNTISFIVDETEVASLDSTSLYVNGLEIDDILLDNTSISTNNSNSDLELRTDGTGELNVEGLILKEETISNTLTDSTIEIAGTGNGWIVFEGDSAVKFPTGNTASRPTNPVLGQTRVNTDSGELETWIGTEWRTSAGEFASISEDQMEEEAFIQTLIYG